VTRPSPKDKCAQFADVVAERKPVGTIFEVLSR
jgi:hypothetical protein